MKGPHQIERKREDVRVTEKDLLAVPAGTRTEAGLRQNIRVGVQYLEAWLGGAGCVPLYGLMEDAATAEISRTQIWQGSTTAPSSRTVGPSTPICSAPSSPTRCRCCRSEACFVRRATSSSSSPPPRRWKSS